MSEYDVLNSNNNTAAEEKTARDIQLHLGWLKEAEALREVITLFRKEKVYKKKESGYLYTLLLESQVSELESAIKARLAQDVVTGPVMPEEKKDDASIADRINSFFRKIKSTVNEMSSYGVNTEIKYPSMPNHMEKKQGEKTKEKKSAEPLSLVEAKAIGEIYAKIEDKSESKDTQYPGTREMKDTLTAELKAIGKASVAFGKMSGKQTRRADDLIKSEEGDRYKPGGMGAMLFSAEISAEGLMALWAATELTMSFDNVGDINLSDEELIFKSKLEVGEEWIKAGKSAELKAANYFLTPKEEKMKLAYDVRKNIAKKYKLKVGDLENITLPGATAGDSLTKGLAKLRTAGRTGVTASGKASAGVKISAFPGGFTSKPNTKSDDPPLSNYAVSANLGAEAFAGTKTEGNIGFSLLASKFGTHGFSANVKGTVSAGVGGSARAELGAGAQGVKFHTSLGATLGLGTELGVDVGMNALAVASAVKERLAPLVSKLSKSKGEEWRTDSVKYGTKQKMLDLYEQLTSSIDILASRLDKLQSSGHSLTAIAAAMDNAFANTGSGFQTAASERVMELFQGIALNAQNIMNPEPSPEPLAEPDVPMMAEQPESEDGMEDVSRSQYELRGMAILHQEIEELRQELNEQRREFFKDLYDNQR
jgi:hypothetical protein